MASAKPAFTIGADPEFFLVGANGEPIPVCGLIGGTKAKPRRLEGMSKGYTVQEDNVMVEFNIPPATNGAEFHERIHNALGKLDGRLMQMGLIRSPNSSMFFPNSALDSPQAQQFGCSPDFQAHEFGGEAEKINPKDFTQVDGAWRFAGGHVHLGYSAPIPPFVVASLADLFLGLGTLPSDKQGMRRTYYGQAGRYRPTPYGIEYRTLSNFWLNQNFAYSVGHAAEALLRYISSENPLTLRQHYSKVPWGGVREAINTQDTDMAHQILGHLQMECDIPARFYT